MSKYSLAEYIYLPIFFACVCLVLLDTAVEESQRALMAAKVEASSAHNGIGLVKLMGRSSGFIAVQSSLASGVVDVCLIPEV